MENNKTLIQLERLSDAIVESIINTPDEEILKEVEEDYGDSNFIADKMKKILKTVKEQIK